MSEGRLLHAAAWGQVLAAEQPEGPPVWIAELAAPHEVEPALELCTRWLELRHPVFAPLLEATVEPHAAGRVLRVVHESPRGSALAELVPQSLPLPERAVALLLYDLARGLALAHEQGLVAGNVAPTQLALCPPGLDDATAVLLHQPGLPHIVAAVGGPLGEADSDRASAVLPPPAYVAPEVLAGQEASAAADVYGLCATAAFCLLARSLLPAGEPGLVRQMALRGLAISDVQELLRLAPTLGPLVVRGLAVQPWGRSGVLDDWAKACEALLAGRAAKLVRGFELVPPWALGSPLVPLAAWAHARWWTARTERPSPSTAAKATDDRQAQLKAALQRLDLERMAARRSSADDRRSLLSYWWVVLLFALVALAIVVLGNRQARRFDEALHAAGSSQRLPPKPLPKPRPRPPEVIFETTPDR